MKDAKKKGSKDNSMSIKTCYVIGDPVPAGCKGKQENEHSDVPAGRRWMTAPDAADR